MGISDRIEAFIMELMKEDSAEFGRNELAEIFNCVPSQINYVISTRFSPEKGYAVESRRGGGGYIKIRRLEFKGAEELMADIGQSCTQAAAAAAVNYLYEHGALERQAARVALAAVSDRALTAAGGEKDAVRARVLKSIVAEVV